jgi:hypothetical protein
MGHPPGTTPTKTKPKTSERWKNIRGTTEELRDINDLCRGMEIEQFERDRVLRKVSQKEGLRALLGTELAQKYIGIARANKTPRGL